MVRRVGGLLASIEIGAISKLRPGITQCPIPAGKSFVYNFTLENQVRLTFQALRLSKLSNKFLLTDVCSLGHTGTIVIKVCIYISLFSYPSNLADTAVTGTQYLDGIFGPLVIHAPEEAETRKLYDREQVLLVQDWYHDFSTINLATYLASDNENTEPIPDNGLFNGRA